MAQDSSSGSANGSASGSAAGAGGGPKGSKTSKRSGKKAPSRSGGSRPKGEAIETGGGTEASASRMIVNFVPGDECRIAFVEDGKLEQYLAEPTQAVSRVNNIYLGVVRSVNTAVQAAFVDFGLDEHGFLHTTDVHPRYFPQNEEGSERVGLKTPRRERPPLQKCFKPGERIMVQVLKEGVGTKGPTLTSYISIPGRYLVMMPGMDNVGVSRKVEDEQTRRTMRSILDQLDLPDGFGFILRTAGLEASKTELKRDLAYLKRLWSDMEKRQKGGRGPVALYAESDLLLRALRDLIGSEVQEIIIDDPGALARAERFLKIVAPRNRPRLRRYTGAAPVFAAFGIERQIQNIHSREVPLPSGGRLVIDETEALVAIDVNSGRSRQARDAETNAFKTNMEAVDEICRQIRLRDLGGLVINDLIDMRFARNRQAVEQRFAERLRRDRARSTILPISEFGILEMTRQRMRSSHERTHFAECPTCKGRGLIRRPDSVAAEALRELAELASREVVSRVELVVSGQVATHLLSGRRKQLSRIERQSGVIAEVRVSDTMAIERFVLHAYDASGADIDLAKLPRTPDAESLLEDAEGLATEETPLAEVQAGPVHEVDELEDEPAQPEAHPIELDAEWEDDDRDDRAGSGDGDGDGRRRRRRRRRRRGAGADAEGSAEGVAGDAADGEEEGTMASAGESDAGRRDGDEGDGRPEDGDGDGEGGRRRRRRRRRRRGGGGGDGAGEAQADGSASGSADASGDGEGAGGSLARRLASALREDGPAADAAQADASSAEDGPDDGEGREREDDPGRGGGRRRRRRRGRRSGADAGGEGSPAGVGAGRGSDRGSGDDPEADTSGGHAGDDEEGASAGAAAPAEERSKGGPGRSGLIEPRPKRAASGPRFLYAAHRRTRPVTPPTKPESDRE